MSISDWLIQHEKATTRILRRVNDNDCFLPQYPHQRKFFSECHQERNTKKEQALSITFSQTDWLIPQNERF